MLSSDGTFHLFDGTRKVLQLDNTGTLYGRRVIVDQTTWPDFVFEKSYTLPTLKATEHYIQENGHLPDVPSAAEVTKNGLDVGEMNKILLQKVEELTLHLIAQEKELIQLKKKLSDLEEK